MKSRIKTLADYKRAEFPREIDVRCPEEYLQKQLRNATRSGKHSEAVNVLEKGDAAVLTLVSELPRFNRPMVTVAVGSGLFDKGLEEQLVGRAVNGSFTAEVQGRPVSVTIHQAVRTVFPELTDELAAEYAASQEGMEGIRTVADFHRRVAEQYREEKRQEALWTGVRACMDYVMAHSEWEFDEAEISAMIESSLGQEREFLKRQKEPELDALSSEDFQRIFGVESRQQLEQAFRRMAEQNVARILWWAAASGLDPAQAAQTELDALNGNFVEAYVSSQLNLTH